MNDTPVGSDDVRAELISSAVSFRALDRLIEGLKPFFVQIVTAVRRPPPTPPGPTPETIAFQRILKEEMKKQFDFLMERFELVVQRVDSAAQTCVRNESHLKRIEGDLEAFERTSLEIAHSTKESFSAEMKLQFEAQMKEFKSVHGKSFVQKVDSFLKDIETAEGFPGRIGKLAEKILYRLLVLKMLFGCVGFKPTELKEVASAIELLPDKCRQLNWRNEKFEDFERSASTLLHSYFQTGDKSSYELAFSCDVTQMISPILSVQGGPFAYDAADLGASWILKSKTDLKGSAVCGKLKFPSLYFGCLKGSVSVPVPYTNIKGSVQFLHEYGGVFASMQAGKKPLGTLSCTFGLHSYSVGAAFALNPLNTVSKMLTKYDVGGRYNSGGLDVTFILGDMTDSISASSVYKFGPVAAGLHNCYTRSSCLNKSFVGLSFKIDPMTLLKGRLGLQGRVSAEQKKLLEPCVVAGLSLVRSWGGRCVVGLSTEFDLHKRNFPRFGAFLRIGPVKEEVDVRRDHGVVVKSEDFDMFQ